ncbi:MAG: hypothetical protein EBZ77_17735 [Chitinophagia bacterium]|nr:hypothetical protein [Chitinophagia bacterium]
MILELKGKLTALPEATLPGQPAVVVHNTASEDALIALVNLGISKAMAEGALRKVADAESLSVEQIIKQALKNL